MQVTEDIAKIVIQITTPSSAISNAERIQQMFCKIEKIMNEFIIFF